MDYKMKDLSTTAVDVKKDPTATTAAVTAVESSTAQQGNDETNQALPATDTAPAEQDTAMTTEENRNNNNNNKKNANDSSLSSRKKRSMEETKAASAMETEANVTSNEAPASKRPRTETTTTTTTASLNKDNNNEDDPSQEQQQQLPVISYLLEHGKAGPNGKVQPTQLKMTMTPAPGQELEEGIPNMIRLLVGDDVMVFQGNDDDNEDKPSSKRLWPPAKIQSFSERGGTVFFTAQWYLNKHDIAQLPLHVPWKGPLTRQELMERILQKDTDVVLSNQTDENEIGAIYGMARVQLEGDQHHQPVANHDIYHCRYQLEVKPNEMILTPYAASDVASVATHSTTTAVSDKKKTTAKPAPKPSVSNLSKTPDNSESEEESEDDDDDGPRGGRASGRAGAVAEGEGSILRESIEVGPEHQAEVPPFVPNTPPPRSRGPKLVWKQGQFSDAQLAAYLHGVAAQHTPFLDRHGLSQPVAYTPVLNPDQVDALLDYRGPERLTGSSLSSAAQMAQMADPQGRPRVCLRKECDPDVLLEILTDCGGRVEEAIEVATSDLQRITSSAWTASQRARYDEGFRKHSGALRKIAKALAPQKSMQDVVDYHFRTKIPNQFRQFFEKKRETAVRIIEVMEEKKTVQVMAQASLSVEDEDNNNDDNEELSRRSRSPVPPAQQQQQQHWNETSVHDVANQGVSEGRRRKARELMLDVQELLGHDILAEVADRIRELNQEYTTEARKGLLAVLQGHADLQKRFVDFLPKAPN